jgi:hypothetical protein
MNYLTADLHKDLTVYAADFGACNRCWMANKNLLVKFYMYDSVLHCWLAN